MLARAIEAGVPFAWFTADEVYGQAKYLRRWLEERDVAYVMAIRLQRHLPRPRQRAAGRCADRRAVRPVLAAAVRRRGAHGPRSTTGPGSPSGPAPGRPRALAAGPPLPARPGGDRLLRLLRAPPLPPDRPGLGRRQPLAHRGMLPAGQERGRARSLSGSHLAGLVRPHHPVDARPGLACSQPRSGRKRGTGTTVRA